MRRLDRDWKEMIAHPSLWRRLTLWIVLWILLELEDDETWVSQNCNCARSSCGLIVRLMRKRICRCRFSPNRLRFHQPFEKPRLGQLKFAAFDANKNEITSQVHTPSIVLIQEQIFCSPGEPWMRSRILKNKVRKKKEEKMQISKMCKNQSSWMEIPWRWDWNQYMIQ